MKLRPIKYWKLLALGMILVFPGYIHAQTQSGRRILLFPLDGEKGIAFDVTRAMKANLKQTNRLEVTEYRPDLSTIKRAILEHQVTKADSESNELSARLRIAQYLGSDFIIFGEARGDSSSINAKASAVQVKSGRQYDFASTVRTQEQPTSKDTLTLSAANTITSKFLSEVLGISPPAEPVVVPTSNETTKPADNTTPPAAATNPPANPDANPNPGSSTNTTTPTNPPENNTQPANTTVPPANTTPPNAVTTPPPDLTQQNNTEATAYSTQAETLAAQGDYAGAIQAMRTAVNLAPKNFDLRMKLSGYYRKRGMTAEADSELNRAMALKPDGAVSAEASPTDNTTPSGQDPIKIYRDQLKANPKDIAARIKLGDALWNAGKVNDAALEYAQASNDAPSDTLPYERLARLYASQGQFLEATTSIGTIKQLKGQEDDRPVDRALYRSLIQSSDIYYIRVRGQLDDSSQKYDKKAITREDFFKKVKSLLTETEQLTDFLSDLDAPKEYAKSHIHRTLAASLLSQSITTAQEWLIKNDSNLRQQSDQFARESQNELDTASDMDRSTRSGS